MAARSLLTRGPPRAEPSEAHAKSVPVGKRTVLEVQEKVAPRRAGIKANLPAALLGRESMRLTKGGRVRSYLGVDWADQMHERRRRKRPLSVPCLACRTRPS